MKKEKLTLTIESKIEQDAGLYQQLSRLSSFYSFLERKLFNDLANANSIDNDLWKRLKSFYIREYNIHARYFNALYAEAKGKIDLLKELHKTNQQELKTKLKTKLKKTNKKIAQYDKWLNIYRHKHHWSSWRFLSKNLKKCIKKLISYLRGRDSAFQGMSEAQLENLLLLRSDRLSFLRSYV